MAKSTQSPSGVFVTGTDTGVGKTLVSCALLHALRAQGWRVAGMKPVASGCRVTPHGLRNSDAEQLIAVSSVALPYEAVNPYAFAPAIAPHIAAAQADVSIMLPPILHAYQTMVAQVDAVVVEGAGGWLVPLNDLHSMADLAVALQLPVILVVGIRLGCISHALLSAQAIRARGLTLAGWVANHIEPDVGATAGNVASIAARIDAALLGEIDHRAQHTPATVAALLNYP